MVCFNFIWPWIFMWFISTLNIVKLLFKIVKPKHCDVKLTFEKIEYQVTSLSTEMLIFLVSIFPSIFLIFMVTIELLESIWVQPIPAWQSWKETMLRLLKMRRVSGHVLFQIKHLFSSIRSKNNSFYCGFHWWWSETCWYPSQKTGK